MVSYTQATVLQLHRLACRFFLPLLCFFSSLFKPFRYFLLACFHPCVTIMCNSFSYVNDIWNKSYMNCWNEMKMKKWSSQWTQFMQLIVNYCYYNYHHHHYHYLCNMVVNCSLVCSIWEYVTAFFARLKLTTVLLWCSDHHHHHHHHLIRITVKLNLMSQNEHFLVKPPFFKLGHLTLSVPWWHHSQTWHQTIQILSHISRRIFFSYSLKTFS